MFENSVALVDECDLTWLHVFPYSVRQGTPAAKMPQVDKAAIRDRAARLRAQGEAKARAHLSAQIGTTHRILIEKPRMGRTEGFAPVQFSTDQPVGQIVTAGITGHSDTSLIA